MNRGKFLGILGFAEVHVEGLYPEKFINLASALGVRMWDTVVNSRSIKFKSDLTSLHKLAEVQKKTGYSMEVQKKSGFFVFVQFLLTRKLLLAGFLCFCLGLYFLSGIVWHLDVEGLENLKRREVLDYAESLGLEKWSRIKHINFNEVEQQLSLKFPEIAWVAVEKSGTRITIRIVEKEPNPLQFGEAIDIVAEYDGIISEMMVLQGRALVEPGMTVAKGDVLISGYREDDGIVNAAGFVKAIVFVDGYGEAALEEIEKEFTGKEALVKTLQLGRTSIGITRKEHGFSNYELTESVRYFRGNTDLPIRLLIHHYKEIRLVTKVYTPEEAQELARGRAMRLAHQQVKEHADILKTELKNITVDNIFRYKVTLTIETKIGQEKAQTRGEEIVE